MSALQRMPVEDRCRKMCRKGPAEQKKKYGRIKKPFSVNSSTQSSLENRGRMD